MAAMSGVLGTEQRWEKLVRVGMVKLDAEGLTILPEGKPLTRMIARAFDAYDQTKAQHSAAI